MTQNLIGEVAIVGTKTQGWYVGKVDDTDLTRNNPGIRLTGAYWLGMHRPELVGRVAKVRPVSLPPKEFVDPMPLSMLWVFDVTEVALHPDIHDPTQIATTVAQESAYWAGSEGGECE